MTFDTMYVTYDDKSDTVYRLKPNPDAPPGTGFSYGAVLEWCDCRENDWLGYFFVAPECLKDISEMFARASNDYEEKT